MFVCLHDITLCVKPLNTELWGQSVHTGQAHYCVHTNSPNTDALRSLEVFFLMLQHVGIWNPILVGQFDVICLRVSLEEICALL